MASSLEDMVGEQALKLDHSTLKAQATNGLRECIMAGRIAPGTKLTERDIARLLGISRMPARDALMVLEQEGLVVTKPGGRYLVELHAEDIRQLFQVRLALELMAVEIVASGQPDIDCAALHENLSHMREAILAGDRSAYISSDLEAHRLIWQLAGNPYLIRMLSSIVGPITMFIAAQTELHENWHETLELHEELVDCICSARVQHARQSIEKHLERSLQLSLSCLAYRT